MKNYKIFLLFLQLIGAQFIYSQKYDFNWVTGEGWAIKKDSLEGTAILNFNSQDGNPLIQASTKFKNYMGSYGAVISDKDGNFMFQFNGYHLEDYRNNWVSGDVLICPKEYCGYDPQSCLIIPDPSDNSAYTSINTESIVAGDTFAYVLGLDLFGNRLINLNDNKGFKLESIRTQFVHDSIDIGRVTACRHANGRDWWIIIGVFKSSYVYTLLFDGKKIIHIFKQDIGRFPDNTDGFANFSPDGKYYAATSKIDDQITGNGRVEFYQFDRCSGVLSNRQVNYIDTTATLSIGCAFSPDSKKLYLCSSYYLYQFDVSEGKLNDKKVIDQYDGHIGHIFNLNTSSSSFGSLQLGPDGRIYSNPDFLQSRYMHVINNPNKSGLACDFKQHSITLKSIIITIPTFPNYRLGPIDGSICDTLGIDNIPWCWWRSDQDLNNHLCFEFTDLSAYEVEEWFWDFGDGAQSREKSPKHCFPKNGIYEVCLIVKNLNGSDTLCRKFNIGITEVLENKKLINLEVFPNPVHDNLVVNLMDYFPDKMEVKLINLQGTIISKQRIYQGSNVMSVEEISEGIYFLNLFEKGELIDSKKIIKY